MIAPRCGIPPKLFIALAIFSSPMERIDEMYELLDELTENIEDVLGGISEAIDMLEEGQTRKATLYLRQIEASLEDFLHLEDEDESERIEVEFDSDEDGN